MSFIPIFTPSPAPDGSFFGGIQTAGLTTGLQFCLDAGSAASYTSGQKWLDLSGNGQDFFRGASGSSSSDDPTFTGTPGGLSSGEYFAFDGGDFFTYDSANEAWMNNMHHNNGAFTFMFWWYKGAGTLGGGLVGTNGGLSASEGAVPLGPDNLGDHHFGIGPSKITLETTDTPGIAGTAWNFSAVSFDESVGSGGAFIYLNGGYEITASGNTFNSSVTSPSSSDAAQTMQLGALGNASTKMKSGDRMAGAFGWNVALTKANVDTLWNAGKGRFSL